MEKLEGTILKFIPEAGVNVVEPDGAENWKTGKLLFKSLTKNVAQESNRFKWTVICEFLCFMEHMDSNEVHSMKINVEKDGCRSLSFFHRTCEDKKREMLSVEWAAGMLFKAYRLETLIRDFENARAIKVLKKKPLPKNPLTGEEYTVKDVFDLVKIRTRTFGTQIVTDKNGDYILLFPKPKKINV